MVDDVIIRIVDMPPGANAVTTLDNDGRANIYINSRLNTDAQQRALLHEIKHIERDDFCNSTPLIAAEW
jgi:hypothetical protein